jgi:hypothetical protein
VIAVVGLASSASAAERRVPFWPDATVETIQAQVDGLATLETVRELGRFHRVHGSPGFAAAAEHIRRKAAGYGLEETAERFPADGSTRYAHLELPGRALGTALAQRRRAARGRFLSEKWWRLRTTARCGLIAGWSTSAAAPGRRLRGRGSRPSTRQRRAAQRSTGAVEERARSASCPIFESDDRLAGDDRDPVRWGHPSAYQTKNSFAFCSQRHSRCAARAARSRWKRSCARSLALA